MKERLTTILQRIKNLGGEAKTLILASPASFNDGHEIEQQLNYKIPDDFKNALLTLSSHCELKWFLPNNVQLPNELRFWCCFL